jgi:hypothetical protein
MSGPSCRWKGEACEDKVEKWEKGEREEMMNVEMRQVG